MTIKSYLAYGITKTFLISWYVPQHILMIHTLPVHPLTHAIAHKNVDIAKKSTTRDSLSQKALVENSILYGKCQLPKQ